MLTPKISYIISAYNCERFLSGLLDDLLNKQSLRDIQVVVVDSKSTDKTLSIAREWASRDNRIWIEEQDARTPYGVSWLLGWYSAEGKIVANSNADDRSYPWRGNVIVDASKISAPNVGWYYGGYRTVVDGVPTAEGCPPDFSVDDFSQFFRAGVHIHWKNEIADIVDWKKMLDAAYIYRSAFDYWLTLYFMSLGINGQAIKRVLSIYNQRKDSVEQSDKERNTFESLSAIEEFFPNSPAIKNLYSNPNKEFVARYMEFKKCLI